MTKKDYKEDYFFALNSGMFWEWYPDLSGFWDVDKVFWNKMRSKQERNETINNLTKEENSDTLNEVISDMIAREKLGIKKYGTTIDREDYDLKDWMQHHYEELLDAALYVKKQIQKLENK